MGGFGWHNPFPIEFGGGETAIETVYLALRANAGKGGAADNEDNTVDGLWRQAKAVGIGAASTFGERAVLQVFPSLATDLLNYYERLFLTTSSPADSTEERRATIARRYRRNPEATVPNVEAELQRIDPRFAVLTINRAKTDTTHPGRAFEDYTASEPFGGGRKSSRLPNYAQDYIWFVLLDIGAGVAPSTADKKALIAANKLLGDMLPAWERFGTTTSVGFVLDVDLLDLTSFGS
jgi:hypothetical protein